MKESEGDENKGSAALKRLREAIDEQRAYLGAYEQPSEPLAYETLRAIDDLFCRDLMEPARPIQADERRFRALSTWGVNHALRRIVPKVADPRPTRVFPSHGVIQAQADDFIFNCAALELGGRFEGWLRDGILTGELRRYPNPVRPGMTDILVLKSALSSISDEEIGRAGLRWASNLTMAKDRSWERRLIQRHKKIEPELRQNVELTDGWRMIYSSSREIDEYFMEWGRLYLRRIFSQDMIGLDDLLGGRPFSRYVEVLTTLSGQSQKHIAFAAILLARHPSLHIRNLLTTHGPRETFITSLAQSMDADRGEIEAILASFILSGDNLDVHTGTGDTAWAPMVQASKHSLLLPVYGLDINPFLFLLTDLRTRYEKDWFRVANNRERRWIEEIRSLFNGPRWQTHGRNLRLREAGKDLTDIDFALFDRKTNELALFQLKWQHPVGMDNRGRRSAGKNLVEASNRWVEAVLSWLDRHGVDELMRRLEFEASSSPSIHLFVLGRYHVHLTGFDAHDLRAVWSDWAHFRRTRVEGPRRSISQTKAALRSTLDRSRANKKGESLMLPVGSIALLLNPTSEPDHAAD
ncbi:hypothetical protein [Mesorhizobium sp. M2C.T.Ca.TU.002.02.1.1]|uniref:hypothetical protein n=1 Tax=Mesorhizobium sp. M2C.T.Ca.TU.002.02.1.1 TaxID=2496788 RepID=UPI000FCB2867|nr:hypothetical protein [Mesorhizobium sp. M2C.T.Ca.TU.002.02.1.1]RUU60285.1 hypothetical protein EOD07_04520 [Mesorhizobium sp. M2C.T.Ca.TU.002.02.1.1]RUU68983.1 hypothetical protein EOD04_12220 [Mesorhizobium sp. M2C.T.Ca.TU.009.01.2.1]